MKKIVSEKKYLQFPLPKEMYDRATKELEASGSDAPHGGAQLISINRNAGCNQQINQEKDTTGHLRIVEKSHKN